MSAPPWTGEQVRWYVAALRLSDFPRKVMAALEPLLTGCRSALDVGAGCGAFTLPLARRLPRVTALEPAPAMVEALRGRLARARLRNVRIVPQAWGAAAPPRHDLLLAANVPLPWERPGELVASLERVAARRIVLVHHVDSGRDKFYFDELYPLLFNQHFPKKGDYLGVLTLLHGLGVHAEVRVIEYDFDQPFADLDEALRFWKHYLGLRLDPSRDRYLRTFLGKRLRPWRGGWRAPIRKQSALLSWAPRHR
ncbi:MAG: class I SAM-dependent methyltransferase [candidate division NC10 bacterium]|nr:class I SAM-dependent methyltransferase [candidate division NC10 bacterium]